METRSQHLEHSGLKSHRSKRFSCLGELRLEYTARPTCAASIPSQASLHAQTNEMVERFKSRIGRGEITIRSPHDLEQLLRDFDARCQRVLDGRASVQIVAERLKALCRLINSKAHCQTGSDGLAKARRIADAIRQVSQPDS